MAAPFHVGQQGGGDQHDRRSVRVEFGHEGGQRAVKPAQPASLAPGAQGV